MQYIANLTLQDIMTPEVLHVRPDCRSRDAARLMVERHVSCLLVQDGRQLLGIVTERDVALRSRSGAADTPVSAIMSTPVVTALPGTGISRAYDMTLAHQIRHLVVVDADGGPCGIASESDFRAHIALALLRATDDIKFVMDRSLVQVAPECSLDTALELLLRSEARYLLVTQAQRPIALYSEQDLIAALLRGVDAPADTAIALQAVAAPLMVCIAHDTSVAEASIRMDLHRARHLAVVNQEGQVVGVASQRHVAERLRPAQLLDGVTRERERLAQEKAEAENDLRALYEAIDQAADGIATCSLSGHLRYANRAWADMHGYAPDKLVGKHLGLFHTADQLRAGGEPDLASLVCNDALHAEVGHVRRDGSRFSTSMTTSALRDAEGRLCGFIRVARDTTQSVRAHRELALSQARLRRMVEAAPHPYAYVAADGTILCRSAPFTALLGVAHAELPTLEAWWLLAFPDAAYRRSVQDRLDAAVREARALGGPVDAFDCQVAGANGQLRTLGLSVIPMDDGLVLAFVEVARRVASKPVARSSRKRVRAAAAPSARS